MLREKSIIPDMASIVVSMDLAPVVVPNAGERLVYALERIQKDLMECVREAKTFRSLVDKTKRRGNSVDEAEKAFIKEATANPYVKITSKLSDFLNLHSDSPIVNLTGRKKNLSAIVNAYIKSTGLVSPASKRIIFLNDTLAELFNKPVNSEHTWFQIHALVQGLYDRSEEALAENKRMKNEIANTARLEYAQLLATDRNAAAASAFAEAADDTGFDSASESQAAPGAESALARSTLEGPPKKKARATTTKPRAPPKNPKKAAATSGTSADDAAAAQASVDAEDDDE